MKEALHCRQDVTEFGQERGIMARYGLIGIAFVGSSTQGAGTTQAVSGGDVGLKKQACFEVVFKSGKAEIARQL